MKKSFNQPLFLVFILISLLACGSEDMLEPLPPPTTTPTTPTPTTPVEIADLPVATITKNFTSRDGLDGTTMDSKGNIYISNFGIFEGGAGVGREVYKITPEGEKTKFATFPTNPGGIAADTLDNIYVSVNKLLYQITPSGQKKVYATGTRSFSGLTLDENGIIYSCGYGHSSIQMIGLNGEVTILTEHSSLLGGVGIVYHQGTKSLFVGNFNSGKIIQVTLDGQVTEFTNLGSTIGYLTEMNDNLYATMYKQHTIVKVSIADGTSEIVAGAGIASQTEGNLLEAAFEQPNGIVGDAANNTLYVSEYVPARLTKIKLK